MERLSDPARNAYVQPRTVKNGCQHMGGCGCSVPFHLREPTAAERKFLDRFYPAPVPAVE